MTSEAKAHIDKIISLIKDECQKESIDTSSFILSGEYTDARYSKSGETNQIGEGFRISIINEEDFNPKNTHQYSKLSLIQEKINGLNKEEVEAHSVKLVPEMRPVGDYLLIKSNKFQNDEEVVLHLENGVSVIDFWAEWCGPCVSSMNHNFEMIEKNFEKWNGKVKFFTSCDADTQDNKQDTLNFIEKNNWNRFPEVIQHFYKSPGNPASKIYGVKYIPFIVIVDQKGVLRHVGSLRGVNIEKLVNELLDGKKAESEPESESRKAHIDKVDAEFCQKFEAFSVEVAKLYKEVKSDEARKANYNFGFVILTKSDFNYNLEKAEIEDFLFSEGRFKLKLRKNEHYAFSSLLNKHFTEDEIKKHYFEIELMETFDIEVPENNQCAACQGKIAKENLTFHCPECKLFFCSQCVNAPINDKTGFEALVHKDHYLLAFKNPNPENLKNLDKGRVGKNLFRRRIEEDLSTDHGYSCNGREDYGCNRDGWKQRFVCMNCRPGEQSLSGYIDFCRICFDKLCESGQEFEMSNGHRSDHVYLHMFYSGYDYRFY